MNCNSIYTVVLILITVHCHAIEGLGQQRVQIKELDILEETTRDGQKVRKFIGDVHLQMGNVVLFSDSAYEFPGRNLLQAIGNIQINTPNEKIWADSLYYNLDSEISRFRSRVIVRTEKTLLFSNKINYNFLTKTAFFLSPVRLKDQQGLLTAGQGYYLENRDSAVFRREVQMRDSLQYVEGDSLRMNRRRDTYEIFGRVFADDRKNDIRLKGNYMKADSMRRRVEGDAYLQRYYHKDGQQDTTHIWARKIIYTITDSTDILDAIGNVRIWSKQFSGIADSARYIKKDEIFKLWSNPRAWHKTIQLTGPHINIHLDNQQIRRLKSFPSPFAVQHDTALDRHNQIKGDTLTAHFNQGELDQIHVRPNSQILYFTSSSDNKADGAVQMTARSTRILFENDTLREVKSERSVDGTYLPEEQNPKEKQLKGYSWEPHLRPARPDSVLRRKWDSLAPQAPFPLPKRYLERTDTQDTTVKIQP